MKVAAGGGVAAATTRLLTRDRRSHGRWLLMFRGRLLLEQDALVIDRHHFDELPQRFVPAIK
ncbi:MAG: hypothetical protein AAF961_10735, partial [Planctomycetota bacterium]